MLVVGVDLGTQSCKAVVCDAALGVRGQHAVEIATTYPGPVAEQRVEQDPRAWELAVGAAIAGALQAARATGDDIAVLAITGQLDGCVAVDGDGTALGPALIWQDRRAIEEAGRVPSAQVFAIAGQVADPSHLAPKARWLRARLPGARRFHQPVSYLVERLTGVAVIDPALASTTMLFDLAAGAWSEPLLAAFELEAELLPTIRPATAIAGRLTALGAAIAGLPVGTRVAVGTGDDFATPLGAGIATPGGPVIAAIGTAEVVGALSATAARDPAPEPMVETHGFPSGAFFVENPGWLAGGAIRWATRLFGIGSDAELDALAASAPPGADGATFVPALAGAMTPVWRPHARGTLYGLVATHDRAHAARAVLEGLAFACRDVIERLASMGIATDRVLLLGGGSRSAVWAQLRADVLQRPHELAVTKDTCALGAAMIALVAAGLAPDLVAAAALAPPPVQTFVPGTPSTRDALEAAYARYQRLSWQVASLGSTPWV